jgi:(p)ppGpp synthase/HD superfamily hydrolase
MTLRISINNALATSNRGIQLRRFENLPKDTQDLIKIIKEKRNSQIINHAIEFATSSHGKQVRKGTTDPYITHPLRVALTLIDLDLRDEVVAAGILHDVLEDAPVTFEELEKEFGINIARLVQAASEPNKYDFWENRKSHTINFLKTAPQEVLFISCADKLDNIRSIHEDMKKIGDAVWSRFKRPKENQKWYYEELAKVFKSRIKDEVTTALFNEFIKEVEETFLA